MIRKEKDTTKVVSNYYVKLILLNKNMLRQPHPRRFGTNQKS